MTLTVTKEFQFDCAHMLDNHEGLCKNLHGHTYRVLVTVMLDQDEEVHATTGSAIEGMVVDFKQMKETFNKELFAAYDHAYVYDCTKPDGDGQRIATLVESLGMKTVPFKGRVTAENMARHFAGRLTWVCPVIDGYLRIVSVRVYETPTSYAEVVL